MLYKIGRFSYRHRWFVAGFWVLLVALAGVGAGTMAGTMSNSFSIPGTESQRAIDQLAERFPQAHVGDATAQVVFVAPAGQTLTTATGSAAVEKTVSALKGRRRWPASPIRTRRNPSPETAATRSRRSATRSKARS